ncbi:MAG: hypothetical protein LC745_03110, partial [Planctomycetia bacterium]|nr:hypothetical protein [Planctomycetia bacterium]
RVYFAAAAICRALDRLRAAAADGRDEGGLGWLLHGGLVIEHHGRVVGPVGTLDVMLDATGRPVPPPLIDIFGGAGLHPAETAVLRATTLPLTFPAFMALTFMNTGGVTLRPVDPPAGLVRRHAGRGLKAPVRYHVLDIAGVAAVDRN